MNGCARRLCLVPARASLYRIGVSLPRHAIHMRNEFRTEHLRRYLGAKSSAMSMASRRPIVVDAPCAFGEEVETPFGMDIPSLDCLDGPVKGLCLDAEEFLVTNGPVSVGDMYAIREELFHAYF